MDKKQLLWIIVLSFAAAMLLPRLFGKKSDEQPAPLTPSASVARQAAAAGNPWSYGGTRLPPKGDPASYRLGSLDPDKDYRLQLELDPRGAAVRTAKLTGFYQTVEQKRTKNKTSEQLEDWSYAALTAVPGDTLDLIALPFSTQSISIDDRDISTFISPNRPGGRFTWEMIEQATDPHGTQRITFRLNLRDDPAGKPVYTLYKTYTLAPKSSSFRINLRVINYSGEERQVKVVQYGPTGMPLEDIRGDLRDVVTTAYISAAGKTGKFEVPEEGKAPRSKMLKDALPRDLGNNRDGTAAPAVWAGAGNKFFGCIMYPIPDGINPDAVDKDTPEASMVVPAAQYAFGFSAEMGGTTEENKSQLLLMTTDAVAVAPSTWDEGRDPVAADTQENVFVPFDMNIEVFCGPKSNGLFQETPLYAKLRFTNTITFRSCDWCLVEPLARAVMWIIEKGGSAIGNYGVIIILMVLCIRLALHPITKRSQTSMMKMKKLQPQMQEVQEKYKNDKDGMQKAMMGVWKTTGFSPVLGCAPMFLQMPIWIALWAGLSASVVLRHEGLLPFWITDLAGPDTVIAFSSPVTIPLLGNMMGPIHGLNILPLLLTVFMFLQQKLTPMQSAPTANPDQAKQQKMMMYMMSGMMLLIFYNAPSGLTLYIMASTGGGVLESFVIRKHIREREEMEAALEVKVSAPGKVARGQRPKKPKDRFRM